MGAGLAAQRGWPQGQENGPLSPHSTEGATSASGEEQSPSQQQRPDHGGVGNDLLLYEEVAQTEVQPLEDGDYGVSYGSAASLTNLVPLDRRRSSVVDENNGEVRTAGSATVLNEWGSVPGRDEQLEQRDGREMSVAYDLGAAMSTEDEVRSSCGLERCTHGCLPSSFRVRIQAIMHPPVIAQLHGIFSMPLPLCDGTLLLQPPFCFSAFSRIAAVSLSSSPLALRRSQCPPLPKMRRDFCPPKLASVCQSRRSTLHVQPWYSHPGCSLPGAARIPGAPLFGLLTLMLWK